MYTTLTRRNLHKNVESVIGRWLGPYLKDFFSYPQFSSVVSISIRLIYLVLHRIKIYINLRTSRGGVTRNVRNNLLEITYLPESEFIGVNRSKMVAFLILDEVLQLHYADILLWLDDEWCRFAFNEAGKSNAGHWHRGLDR